MHQPSFPVIWKKEQLHIAGGGGSATHVVLYDLLDAGHREDEDERHQSGVATGRRHVGDLLVRR